MSKPKRRRYLIPGTFQVRFIAASLLYQLVVVSVFILALFLPPALNLGDEGVSAEEAWRAGVEFLVLHDHVWPALSVACVLMLAHAVVFSHRIAGPLHRFRSIFEEVKQGNLLVSTQIRRRDFLLQEADCLGKMLQALRVKIAAIQEHRDEIALRVERLAPVLERASSKEALSDVQRLRRELDQLATTLAHFQTTHGGANKPRTVSSAGKQAAA